MTDTLTEKEIQAVLMEQLLDEKNHQIVTPNITVIYPWECDLLSLTRAGLSHEFEIKRSVGDYRADFKNKRCKHQTLSHRDMGLALPNYFWFVTTGIEIEPPEYAGWIRVTPCDVGRPKLCIQKEAPRLHTKKMHNKGIISMGRICSYGLKKMYLEGYILHRKT